MQNNFQSEMPVSFQSAAESPATAVIPEAKESQILVGRTPQLPYSLHFVLQSNAASPDLMFEFFGTTRAEVVQTFLEELKNRKEADKKQKDRREKLFHVNEFIKEFNTAILDALCNGFIQDEKALAAHFEYTESMEQRKTIFKDIWKRYGLKARNLETLKALLETRKNELTRQQPKGSRLHLFSPQASIFSQELRVLEADITILTKLSYGNFEYTIRRVLEKLNEHCFKLFDQYLNGIASHIPVNMDVMMIYARLKKKSVYVWKSSESTPTTLILSQYSFYENSNFPIPHILIDANKQCHTLVELNKSSSFSQLGTSAVPDEKQNLSEWDEALQLAGIQGAAPERTNTQIGLIRQYTQLPREVVKIIQAYMSSLEDLPTLMKENKMPEEFFWQEVVGFFSVYTAASFKMKGLPPLALVSDKLRTSENSALIYLETWGVAILQSVAERTKKILLGQPDCGVGLYNIFANDRAGKSYIGLLKAELHSTPAMLENMLADEKVVCVVNHYPRLQSIFLEALLANKALISPVVEVQIASWVPDNNRRHQTLSAFQLLRIINLSLRNPFITLNHLKTIAPIQCFLEAHQLDEIEETPLFLTTVCSRAHEFLDASLYTMTSQEAQMDVSDVVDGWAMSGYFDEKFTSSCLEEGETPDWYLIFQYVLLGAKVDKEILLHFAQTGHAQGMRMLLQLPEVDVNAHGHYKDTCLIAAAIKGHASIIDMLLRHPDIYANYAIRRSEYSADCHAALELAVKHQHTEAVRLLLERSETNLEIAKIKPMLWSAYQNNSYAMVSLLFEMLITSPINDKELADLLPSMLYDPHRMDDLRLVAASIAPDIRRLGSIALGEYLGSSKIVSFLLQLPHLNGDFALRRMEHRFSSSYLFDFDQPVIVSTVQQLLTCTRTTVQGRHVAICALLGNNSGSLTSDDEKLVAKKLIVLKLLCSEPGFNIYHEGLLGLAALNFEKLQCVMHHAKIDPKHIKGDEALISIASHTAGDYDFPHFNFFQEKLKTIQYLVSSTQLTVNAIRTALFSILRQKDRSPETLQMLDLLFSQPGISIYDEEENDEENRAKQLPRTDLRRPVWRDCDEEKAPTEIVKKDSLLSLASQQADYLWSMSHCAGVDLQFISGAQALVNAVSEYSDRSYLDNGEEIIENQEKTEIFNTVQQLLIRTCISIDSIYESLFILLYKGSLGAVGLQTLGLLFKQQGVNIYQEDHSDSWRSSSKKGKRNTLFSLALRQADYLWCLAECPNVDLKQISGRQALLFVVRRRNGKLDTVQELLDRTHITLENIYAALFALLRQKPLNDGELEILTFLLTRPGINIHQTEILEPESEKENEEDGYSYARGSYNWRGQKDTVLILALQDADCLFCLANHPGVDLKQMSGCEALRNAVFGYSQRERNEGKEITFHKVQQLLARTQITLADIYEALFILLRRESLNDDELKALTLLLTQPGVDISYEESTQYPEDDYYYDDDNYDYYERTRKITREIKKDSLFSLASKKASYLVCFAQCPGIDLRSINGSGDEALKDAVSSYLSLDKKGQKANEVDINLIERLLQATHVTPACIYASLSTLLSQQKISHNALRVVALLVLQPGITLQEKFLSRTFKKESLLDLVVRRPTLLWCLAKHPEIDIQMICLRLEELLKTRAGMVKNIIVEAKVQIVMPPQKSQQPNVQSESKTVSNTAGDGGESIDLMARLIARFERAILAPPAQPVFKLPASGKAKQNGFSQLLREIRKNQAQLLFQMQALLESPLLRVEHITPLLEKADTGGLKDVVDVLRAAPCMPTINTSSSEFQAAASVEVATPAEREAAARPTTAESTQALAFGNQPLQAPPPGVGTLFDRSQTQGASVSLASAPSVT